MRISKLDEAALWLSTGGGTKGACCAAACRGIRSNSATSLLGHSTGESHQGAGDLDGRGQPAA
jgi:hypothetical protein